MKKFFKFLVVLVLIVGIIGLILFYSIGPKKEVNLHTDLSPEKNLYNIFERTIDTYHDCHVDLTLTNKEATDLLKYFISQNLKQEDIKDIEITGAKITFFKDRIILTSNLSFQNKKFSINSRITKINPDNLQFKISSVKLGLLPVPVNFIFDKFIDKTIENEILSFKDGEIIFHDVEIEQLKLENIFLENGFMTARIKLDEENYEEEMIMLNIWNKVSTEEKMTIIKMLLKEMNNL